MDPESALLQPGMTLGSYRVERLLGQGGMGMVFLAFDTVLHRQVAIKVMTGSDHDLPRSRLLREARNVAALNHPNICTIHEVGDTPVAAFIAMEYVDGRSMRDRLDEAALPISDALRYGHQAADALSYAHARGVIHRDFKAANVIVTPDDRLKVVDFGLASRSDALMDAATTMSSLVPAGTVAGTPYAMAPEQVRGEVADARTDIWALGVFLYEMATGTKPFVAATRPELFSRILTSPPAAFPAAVPAEVRAVIERCLEKNPAHRYQQAGAVASELGAIQAGSRPPWSGLQYYARSRRGLVAAAALLALAAVGVGLDIGSVRERVLGRPVIVPIRLAVMPFENLTGDPDQEYFADGLTEEMITQLGRLHPDRLSVIARTSSMRYKKRDVPIDQIGPELGVNYVLEGSARREGTHIRISATLIDVANQTQRWTNTFERELASILTLESDVARGIAGSLALSLLPAEQARLASARPVNPAAYEAYLRGRSHSIKLTRSDLDAAMEYFQLALEKDPDYGPAYAGIAQVWSARQQMGFAPPGEAAPQMKAAAIRANEIDGASGEAHLRLAIMYTWTDWNWAAAEGEFRKAIDFAPNLGEAHAFYSHYLYIMRRPSEGQTQMQQATESDPLSELVQSLNGTTLLWAGRFSDAMENARHVLQTTPDSPQALNQLATALRHLNREKESLDAEIRWWKARNDLEIPEALTRGYAEGGYLGAMRRAADALAARPAGRVNTFTRVATTYARAGDVDRAIEWLEKGFAARDPNMPYLSAAPEYDVLRGDPRFQSLLRRLNLPVG